MEKLILKDVTLIGIDCVDIERLILAAEVCRKNIDFAAVKLLSHLSSDYPDVVHIDSLDTIQDYSRFVIRELYKYINTKYALIIQWDGFVLDHFKWEPEFLKFDYIGAPWSHNDNYQVGNGGFSLRTHELLRFVAHDNTINECHPEDFVICKFHRENLESRGFRFAPVEIARRFSVESEDWNGQFGFHQTDISKAPLSTLVDGSWHSKLHEVYRSLNTRVAIIRQLILKK